ncbi:MAG: DUF2284 domain-containing protein [Acetobacteraceae bacterium]|nr:DUF2284 domain-containing protein [Acetobacteraceae bacterium]
MSPIELDAAVRRLRDLAVERGAAAARPIPPLSVVTAEWVRLKCQYGCGTYGRRLTCPPHSPAPSVTRKALDDYTHAILLHLPQDWVRLRETTAWLEREAFLMGFHKAFAMPAGPCHLCETCSLQRPCAHPDQARPSMEACGIDVYRTARNAGFSIEVVRSRDCTASYFSLLLVE